MKRIEFSTPDKPASSLQVRNQKEDLIALIVEATSAQDKKALAKRIALAVNTLKWTESELHALLAKKNDPGIRNYTAFVQWSIKTKQS